MENMASSRLRDGRRSQAEISEEALTQGDRQKLIDRLSFAANRGR
jgi:hypothetical protein